jgi:hypothetical protein
MADEQAMGGGGQEETAGEPRSLADAAQEHLDPVVAEENDVPDPEEVQTREG